MVAKEFFIKYLNIGLQKNVFFYVNKKKFPGAEIDPKTYKKI